MKVFIFSILLLLCFSGCEYKEYSADVTIERDGAIYSAMPDEIDERGDALSVINTILSEIYYIGNEWECINEIEECEVVDNDIYNFLVVVSIKSKDDLSTEFRQHDNSEYFTQFFWEKCEETSKTGTMSFTFKQVKDADGYYHYKLYGESNIFKAAGGFDNIKDICLKYDEHERAYEYRTDYTSNEIIIKAQEIKDMLDNLGILYTLTDTIEMNVSQSQSLGTMNE